MPCMVVGVKLASYPTAPGGPADCAVCCEAVVVLA
jgi:hypothetical protein